MPFKCSLEQQRIYRKQYRERHKTKIIAKQEAERKDRQSLGSCARCPEKPILNETLCLKCKIQNRDRVNKYRQEK
jgi:hypothetical protein